MAGSAMLGDKMPNPVETALAIIIITNEGILLTIKGLAAEKALALLDDGQVLDTAEGKTEENADRLAELIERGRQQTP